MPDQPVDNTPTAAAQPDPQKTSKAQASRKDQEVALVAAFEAWDGLIDCFGVEIGRDLWMEIDKGFGAIKQAKKNRGRPRKTHSDPREKEIFCAMLTFALRGIDRRTDRHFTRRLAEKVGGHSVGASMRKIQRLLKELNSQ